MTRIIQLTTDPEPRPSYEVSEADYERLTDLGLVVGGPASPVSPDLFDAEVAQLVDDINSLTRARIAAIPANIPDASETVKGAVEIATPAEATTGTDPARVPSVAVLKGQLDALGTASNVAATLMRRSSANGVAVSSVTGLVDPAQADSAVRRSWAEAQDALRILLTEKGAANGVATLGSDGKVPAAQIPAVAISDFLGTTASQAAMLALVGQRGDWTVRTDTSPNTTWILIGDDPTQLANWKDLPTVVGGVSSVAGRTGAVVLSSADMTDRTATGASLFTAADVAAVKALLAYAAQEVSFSSTGILATNVRDAILELLGYANDENTHWSNSAFTLNMTGTPSFAWKADTDLNYSIAANETLGFRYVLTFSGANANTANLNARIDAPAGASAEWGPSLDWDAAGQAGTPKQALAGIADTRSFRLQTGVTGIVIEGKITNGATAGTVVLNLAPYTTVASGPPIRNAGARVVVDRMPV